MNDRTPRLVLALCSLLLALGGLAHAAAFRGAAAAIRTANLPAVYANDFKTLWLADSATLWIVAALFAMLATRPALATKSVVIMIALVPAATAALIYIFVGGFYAAHLLMGTAAAAAFTGLWSPAFKARPFAS